MSEDKTDKLITENLRLVHMCANKFKNRGIEYEELYSAGCLGLVKAAGNFDATRGFAFSTYAVPAILGEIKRCFRDGGNVRVSRSMKERSRDLYRHKELFEAKLGRMASLMELSESFGVSPSEAAELLNVSAPVISIDTGTDEESRVEIPDASFENTSIDKITISTMLAALSELDRRLIMLRYFEEKTQGETGAALGMTQVQVSRREKVILRLLRCSF